MRYSKITGLKFFNYLKHCQDCLIFFSFQVEIFLFIYIWNNLNESEQIILLNLFTFTPVKYFNTSKIINQN